MSDSHLSISERSCIYQFLNLGMRLRMIAKALHRLPNMISREISRNKTLTRDSYPHSAQKKYDERRLRCHRKVSFSNDVVAYIKVTVR